MPRGESTGHYHVIAPSVRSAAATAILKAIHRKNAGGVRLLFLSDSTYEVACSIVGYLGRANIGRGIVALGTPIRTVQVPDTVIPLAATLVSNFLSQISRTIPMHRSRSHFRLRWNYMLSKHAKRSLMGDPVSSRTLASFQKTIE